MDLRLLGHDEGALDQIIANMDKMAEKGEKPKAMIVLVDPCKDLSARERAELLEASKRAGLQLYFPTQREAEQLNAGIFDREMLDKLVGDNVREIEEEEACNAQA